MSDGVMPSALRRPRLKYLQPVAGEAVRHTRRGAKLFRSLTPVKTKPAVGDGVRASDELAEFGGGAFHREHFLDDHRLADLKVADGGQIVVQLAVSRVNVDGKVIELGGDFGDIEAAEVAAIGQHADGDEVLRILLADGGGEGGDPLAGDFGARKAGLIERNELGVVET